MKLLSCFFIVSFLIAQCLYAQDSQELEPPVAEISEDSIQEMQKFSEQFMTEKEYGGYLYEEPRGISCKVCHGEYGKGMLLGTYVNRGKTYELNAPDITGLEFKRFSRALRISKGVMPKYYLTDSEITALYRYISEIQQ